MKKALCILFSSIFVLLIANNCTGNKFDKYKKIAEKTSKQLGLPKQIGQNIQMDSVVAVSANELKFCYTFLEELSLTSDEFVEMQTPMLIESVKQQSRSSQFKAEFDGYSRDNITLTYVYFDKFGSVLGKISVKPEDYK